MARLIRALGEDTLDRRCHDLLEILDLLLGCTKTGKVGARSAMPRIYSLS
jgi:hypothetical protein